MSAHVANAHSRVLKCAAVDALWTYRELTNALALPGADGPRITGVAIDSRLVEPGDLFVALPGDPGPRFQTSARSNRDGHDFARHAVANGASAVLVHRPGDYGAPALVVNDTLDALWDLGRAARNRLSCPVVAVTGSSGKTTFKTFAANVLQAFCTEGSLNNHLGVPLSLARTPRSASGAVYEIGTSFPGEIEPLARLASPDVAVVLNVHPAHIGHFGSVEAIAAEKLSIARGLSAGGALVRSADLEAEFEGRTVTFGKSLDCGVDGRADVTLDGLEEFLGAPELAPTSRAVLTTAAGRIACPVPGGGQHRGLSVCALAAVLMALGRPLGALERLAGMAVPRGRGNRHSVGGVTVIDESYNANPASMAATLKAFAEEPGGRRIAILGDMLELGEDAIGYHAELAPLGAKLHGVFCVGPRMRTLYDALPSSVRLGWTEEANADCLCRCAEALEATDSVLVKASNGVFWAAGFVDKLIAALDASQARKTL